MFYQSGYPMGVVDPRYSNNLRRGTPRPNVADSSTGALRPRASGSIPTVDNFYNIAAFQRRTESGGRSVRQCSATQRRDPDRSGRSAPISR